MLDEARSSETNDHTSGVTIGDVEGGIHDTTIAGGNVIQWITHIFTGGPEQQRAQRNRRALLQLVRNTWIKGVLEQSLYGAAMIELGLEERADAVERPWDIVLQTDHQSRRLLPPGTKMVDVLDEMNGALLILGDPGSGKTTMLLELARETIARAEKDFTRPIPVVFNLSSWAERRQSITEWLVDELNTKYNIPKAIARPWVDNDDLLLLLDGLDEVEPEQREGCVGAINLFRQKHGLASVVVCSRVVEYEALTTRLKLRGAILLQPLTPAQVDAYLTESGRELAAVHTLLQEDQSLQELTQSPLMLSVMTLAYRGIRAEELQSLNSIDARRQHLFDTYIQQMLQRRRIGQQYSPENTIHWLSCLARRLLSRNEHVFLIEEQVQPDWLATSAQQRFYSISVTLIITFLILTSLIPTALGGVLLASSVSNLQSRESYAVSFASGLALLSVLFISMALGLFHEPGKRLRRVNPIERLTWSWSHAMLGCLVGMMIPSRLLSGLMILPIITGMTGREIEKKTVPNQGVLRSAKTSVRIGIVVWLVSALIFTVPFMKDFEIASVTSFLGGLLSTISLALPVALAFGGRAVVQHLILRWRLSRNGTMPWKCVRFLDCAAELIFLRKVGGGYIFVHRLLQDYFASLEQS